MMHKIMIIILCQILSLIFNFCIAEVQLGEACPQPDACGITDAECNNVQVCACPSTHYDSNSAHTPEGTCELSMNFILILLKDFGFFTRQNVLSCNIHH